MGAWQLYRFDELNLALEPTSGDGDTRRRFYPDLPSALQALYLLLLDEGCREATDLAAILAAIAQAEQRLLRALKSKTL